MLLDEKSTSYVFPHNLRQLFRLRTAAIAAQSVAVAVATLHFHMALPLVPMILALAALTAFNAWTRIRINRPRPVSSRELLVQLVVDVAVLTLMLGLSGGATNPFGILYLLPLTIATVVLPTRAAWFMAGLTSACYSLLLVVYVPLPAAHEHGSAFSLHVFGMWLGFVLSAWVVAYFVGNLRSIVRRQRESLNRAREEAVRNEYLVKLGVMAASTAHDMGTPLNSMALLLEDIECEEAKAKPGLLEKTALFRTQLARCREALGTLSQSAGELNLAGGRDVAVRDYLQSLAAQWKAAHPATNINLSNAAETGSPNILADEILNHALMNIVDNAAEASPEQVDIHSRWDNTHWYLTVRDFGPGLTGEAKQRVGRPSCSTKAHGLGLGLFLTHAVIDRLGGVVDLYNHAEGGLCTQVRLPVKYAGAAI